MSFALQGAGGENLRLAFRASSFTTGTRREGRKEMMKKKTIPLARPFSDGSQEFTNRGEHLRSIEKSWFRGKDAGRSLGIGGLTGSCLLHGSSFSFL